MVDTKPQQQYNLIFSLGHAGDKCQQPLAIMAFAGDQAKNIHYLTRTDDKSSLCGPVVDDVRVWGLSRSGRNMQAWVSGLCCWFWPLCCYGHEI
ncbi:hypothetical protein IFM89_013983 [Coptis chinensis]|uniref:Uncharacterized protein n=1 Tax=Coptis chinensis TaxID=261450 RepID=A0A835IS67_9MAGN|nr:hypothetical protein IFM89_013983 [Coptis chinensis]